MKMEITSEVIMIFHSTTDKSKKFTYLINWDIEHNIVNDIVAVLCIFNVFANWIESLQIFM